MRGADLIALLPLLLLLATAVALLGAIALTASHRIAAGVCAAGIALSFAGLWAPLETGARAVTPLLGLDPLALFYMGLILASAFLIALLSFGYLQRREVERAGEYYLLLVTATLGAASLAASTHFASFFLAFEILSVSLYAMIAYVEGALPVEAGIKYLILAGASSAVLLFGAALLYDALGTLEFAKIATDLAQGSISLPALVGSILVLSAIAFKLALVPFHMWAPDVYEGAPLPVAALIATLSKGAVFALLLRFLRGVGFVRFPQLYVVLSILAIASMSVGNLLALLQNNLKRLLAYSSTAHLGYLLIAVIAGSTGGEALGAEAASFYLIAYIATNLAAFGVMIALSGKQGEAEQAEDYRSLFWRRPALAAVLAIALFSLAGIPLTGGFTGKFLLARAGIGRELWGLVIVLAINSAIGLFYYLRLALVMAAPVEGTGASAEAVFLPKPGAQKPSAMSGAVLGALTLWVIWLGVFPGTAFGWVQTAVRGFLR